jgi:hypothetical protein
MASIELPESFTGALRNNAETVMSVIGKTAKRAEDIVTSIQNKFKKEERHLSLGQVKQALKGLVDAELVMSENVATGTKGRPPKAYKLFTEEAASSGETPAGDA